MGLRFMVSWFHGFMVSWFHGFMILWFHGFQDELPHPGGRP